MPTGYTAELMEEGQTFEKFVLGCARAFGALITMRDAPNDAQIPDKFEPSDWHQKALAEAQTTLFNLKAMKGKERNAFARSAKARQTKAAHKQWEKSKAENDRLAAMRQEVENWQPPSGDHIKLREFMIDQLQISKNDTTYYFKEYKRLHDKTTNSFYRDAVDEAEHSIQYNTEQHAAEVERSKERTEWVLRLKASLKTHGRPLTVIKP